MTSLGYLQYSEINDSSTNSAMTEIDKKKQDNGYTQVLLSKNRKGYQNL